MKRYIFILISFINICCNGQKDSEKINIEMNNLKQAPYNITDDGDGARSSFDDLPKKMIEEGVSMLHQRNFKFPDNILFQKKIQEIFNFDIYKYKNDVIALRGNTMFPELAIKANHFILLQDADSTNSEFLNQNLLFWYNSYIFYQDIKSYEFLKMQYPEVLKDLVVEYGYNKDSDLTKWVLGNFNYDDENQFSHLIFSYNPSIKKHYIREHIFNDIEKMVYNGKTDELLSPAKEGNGYDSIGEILSLMAENKDKYIDCDRSIAFICEKSLNVGDIGDVQNFLSNHKQFIKIFKDNNYFGFERLKIFVENIEVIAPIEDTGADFNYIVHDPDGYTNLRKDKDASSEIIQKIKTGEKIKVLDNSKDWFLIETKEGKQGYVHKSRVKSE